MKPGDLVTLSHGNPLERDYFFVYTDFARMAVGGPNFTVPEDTMGLLVELKRTTTMMFACVLFPQGIGWINSVWLELVE